MIDLTPLERHGKGALMFSGGKDSTAVLWLLRDHLPRLTVYHVDTGDLLPEVRAVVDAVRPMCPNFVHIKGDVRGWIAQYGMPTDILPYSTHGIGVAMGQNKGNLVTRYQCCFTNLMFPAWDRIKQDGHTLVIRGTKTCDLPRLPATTGDSAEGIELWLPIADWSHKDVFAYLEGNNAPISTIYSHVTNAPECARCSAWWGEKRAAYLREHHPALFEDYRRDLRVIGDALAAPIADLARELAEVG